MSEHKPRNSSSFQPTTLPQRKGSLYGKKGIYLPWTTFNVNVENNMLTIEETAADSNVFGINIFDYELTWRGKLQDKFTFAFQNVNDSATDLRWLYLGANEESLAQSWYKYFSSIMASRITEQSKDTIPQELGTNFKLKSMRNIVSSVRKSHHSSGDKNAIPENDNASKPNNNGYHDPRSSDEESEEDYPIEGKGFSLPEEAPEWVETIFNQHIANSHIWKEFGGSRDEDPQWEVLEQGDGKLIAGSKIDPQLFKADFSFRRTSAFKVLQVLLDVEKRSTWDKTVESVKVQFYMPSTKQSIIRQVNRTQGTFYLKREFVYMRYVFQTQKAYFIIDKSHKSKGIVPGTLLGLSKNMLVTGDIDYYITRIIENNGKINVKILTKMTQGGVLTSGQDRKLTQSAISNVQNMEKVFSKVKVWDITNFLSVPCPRREEKARSRQMMKEHQDNKEKSLSPSPNREEIRENNGGSRNRGMLGERQGSRKLEKQEENLEEEDIDEKILVISKHKKRDLWEIDVSASNISSPGH